MRTKHCFNMVEILLALGVCAIGVCSIMVLFPVGAAATRDAAMETYAAHAADQMLHFMKYRITASKGADWGTIISTDDNSGEIITELPDDEDYSLADLNSTDIWETGSWADEMKGTLYQKKGNSRIFQVISHRNPADKKLEDPTDFDTAKIDFRGILTIWKEKISVNGNPVPYTMGVKLNVKVAWPAELPATSRQVAYYCLEVFKP